MIIKALLTIVLFTLIGPLDAKALEYGHYYPLYNGAQWTYQSVDNPGNFQTQSVCCPFEVEGEPALLWDVNGEYQVAFRKDGGTIIWYGYFQDGSFTDFVPDMVLDIFEDGAIINYPCDTPPCDEYEFIRIWSELDHPDLGDYDMDPGYDDLVVFAHYTGGEGTNPNSQNEVFESNLPVGITPPPGAVTDLEWHQRGLGVVALMGVSASNGDLHEKFELVDVSPVPDDPVADQHLHGLQQNSPNPFNPQTTIAFELPRHETVILHVFDMAGRLVRELIGMEEYAPGRHEVVWNGRDDNGRQVASGTYFYRLEAGSYSETKRMVLIK